MGEENPIWKWYKRHVNGINAVLDIAAQVVPGGVLVLNAVKALHATIADQSAQEDQQQIEEAQRVLEEIKPIIQDCVEDIEDEPAFSQAKSAPERQAVAERCCQEQLKQVLPQLGQTLVRSASRLSSKSSKALRVINGKYELRNSIGGGGEGKVYQGYHILGKREIAIKILPLLVSQDQSSIQRLQQEYQRVSELVHPHIVQYRDIDQDRATQEWFFVMDFVAGKNLRTWWLDRGRKALPYREATTLLRPVAEALQYAHGKSVAHCDLKPENVLIRTSDQQLLLTDFGLSQEIRYTVSRYARGNEHLSGTLPYMAPEQYQGKRATEATDVWALGVMLYEIVTGEHPFLGTSFEHFERLVCQGQPDRPDRLTDQEWQTLQRMLAKDRQARLTIPEWLNPVGVGVVVQSGGKEAVRGKKKSWVKKEADANKSGEIGGIIGMAFGAVIGVVIGDDIGGVIGASIGMGIGVAIGMVIGWVIDGWK